MRERRHLLSELRRKYGDTLEEVLEFRAETAARLSELESHEERAAELDARRARAEKALSEAATEVGRARRTAAPGLADAAVARLRELAMPNARLEIQVGADPGDDVTILFSANPGSAPLPLAKVASGGELARTMLALRLVTTEAPPTLVFDEVDAGIGGTTALALAAALAELGGGHQVLVVTHLPQVAAFADAQVTHREGGHRRPHGHPGPAGRRRRAGGGAVPHAVGPARLGHGPPARRRAAGRGRPAARPSVTVLLGFLAGVAGGFGGWLMLRPTFAAPIFARQNHRGVTLPTAVGLVVPLAVLASETALQIAEALDWEPNAVTDGPRAAVLILALGLGLLGLLDDLAGEGESGGFSGHLRALRHGRFTTGSLKLFGGAAVAIVAVQGPRSDSLGRVFLDAALIALCANAANLFDRAPGRTLKVTLLAFVVLAAATGAPAELLGVAVAVGAGAGLLWPDLREQMMLGDVGANVLGGVIGLGVVIATAPATRTVVLLGVLALNLASEAVSFSAVIDRLGPLRALDRAGRKP